MRIETKKVPHPHGLPDDFWTARLINVHGAVVMETLDLEEEEARAKMKPALLDSIEYLEILVQSYKDAIGWIDSHS